MKGGSGSSSPVIISTGVERNIRTRPRVFAGRCDSAEDDSKTGKNFHQLLSQRREVTPTAGNTSVRSQARGSHRGLARPQDRRGPRLGGRHKREPRRISDHSAPRECRLHSFAVLLRNRDGAGFGEARIGGSAVDPGDRTPGGLEGDAFRPSASAAYQRQARRQVAHSGRCMAECSRGYPPRGGGTGKGTGEQTRRT